jgi:hypothetical protein
VFAPTAIPVWYFAKRKRLALIRIQNYTSVTGKSDRSKINYFIADPTIVTALNRRWWVTVNNEFKWDWRLQRGSSISGVQLGRMVRSKFGFWLKPEFPWGGGRQGQLNFKFTVFRIR